MTDADAGLPSVEDVTEWFREKGFSLTIEEPNGSDRFHAYAVKVRHLGTAELLTAIQPSRQHTTRGRCTSRTRPITTATSASDDHADDHRSAVAMLAWTTVDSGDSRVPA